MIIILFLTTQATLPFRFFFYLGIYVIILIEAITRILFVTEKIDSAFFFLLFISIFLKKKC